MSATLSLASRKLQAFRVYQLFVLSTYIRLEILLFSGDVERMVGGVLGPPVVALPHPGILPQPAHRRQPVLPRPVQDGAVRCSGVPGLRAALTEGCPGLPSVPLSSRYSN